MSIMKVTKAEIVQKMVMTKDREGPYYSILYREVGKYFDERGFSSFYLDNVSRWKEEYMKVVGREVQ